MYLILWIVQGNCSQKWTNIDIDVENVTHGYFRDLTVSLTIARGLLMGSLLLNECLSLLWAMAMATAMIAKCECGGCSVAAS